ncbi:unnamed protein product [Linum tenue]|uniref:RING-type domain-containing protein n=1 Tax=Linum tenue TaxID=586396 RepID=A0AAV0R8D1_9ROSI|nr:unnamed protein product [Linum tenue]
MLSYLKLGWEILLHASFFHPYSHLHTQHYPTSAAAAAAHHRPRGGATADEDVECAVCLSKIEEGDAVPELTCRHAFHQVCLDRWSNYSILTRRRHPACPLCRRSLTGAPEEVVVVFDFARFVCSDDARHTWWLR